MFDTTGEASIWIFLDAGRSNSKAVENLHGPSLTVNGEGGCPGMRLWRQDVHQRVGLLCRVLTTGSMRVIPSGGRGSIKWRSALNKHELHASSHHDA